MRKAGDLQGSEGAAKLDEKSEHFEEVKTTG